MRVSTLIAAAVLGTGGTSLAQSDSEHVTVRVLENEKWARPGEPHEIGIEFTIDEGWHLYWNGLNDTGFPPEIEWKLPEGFEVIGPVWPVPVRHISPGDLVDHIYEKKLILKAGIRVPRGASEKAHIEADIKWLVCREVCLPGDAHISFDLAIAPVEVKQVSTAVLHRALAASGLRWVAPKAPTNIEHRIEGDLVTIVVPGATKVVFYPRAKCTPPKDLIKEGEATGDRLSMHLRTKPGKDVRVVGLLEATFAGEAQPKVYEFDTAPPKPNKETPPGDK